MKRLELHRHVTLNIRRLSFFQKRKKNREFWLESHTQKCILSFFFANRLEAVDFTVIPCCKRLKQPKVSRVPLLMKDSQTTHQRRSEKLCAPSATQTTIAQEVSAQFTFIDRLSIFVSLVFCFLFCSQKIKDQRRREILLLWDLSFEREKKKKDKGRKINWVNDAWIIFKTLWSSRANWNLSRTGIEKDDRNGERSEKKKQEEKNTQFLMCSLNV